MVIMLEHQKSININKTSFNFAGCPAKADIVFLLDSSGSVGRHDFQTVRNFVISVVDEFNLAPNQTRVGMAGYSTDVWTNFHLDKYESNDAIRAAIKYIPYKYGSTNTAGGLARMREMFEETYGDRPDVQNFGIVVTDGVSNVGEWHTIPEAHRCRDEGIVPNMCKH